MTKAVKNMIGLSSLIDSGKRDIIKIKRSKALLTLDIEDVEFISLYYSLFSLFEKKEDVSLDTISFIVKNEHNADRIKAVYSGISSGVVWTNILSFNAAIQAISRDRVDADKIIPFSPEEISWGIVVLMGIEGSEFLPAKQEVLKYISASIDFYSGGIVPVTLAFSKIEEMSNYKTDIRSPASNMSIVEMSNLTKFPSGRKISNSEKNELLEGSEISTFMVKMYNRMVSEWSYLIE